MYQLGPIDLVDFGLIPSVVDNSTNLALSGCWDFPARLGKSFQDWNDDQNGVEPYVREEEIRLAGRDITFVALLSAESENAALLKCYELYKLVGGLNSLVPFTTDLGTFNVYLKDQVIADYIGDGWCKLKFTFREPILNYSGVIPAASNAELGIDGIAFKDLGLTVLDVTGRWNRPAPKNFKATFYENEGYKVSKLQNREVTIKALLSGANYTEFIGHLNGLYLLLKKEGLRYITYGNDMYRSFFVKDGFQVSNVLQAGNGETTGVLTCKFTEVTASSDWSFLMTSTGSELTDKLGQKIIVVPPDKEANLDFTLTVETTLPNSVPNAGGTYELQIASNAEFFVLESHSFLSLSDSAGQNSGTITVNVEANVSTARTGTITVIAGDKLETITVAQGAGAVVNTLAVDVSTVSNAATGGNTTITVTSNVAWTVSSNMPFVTANKTGAFGNSTFVLTVAPNTTAFVRTAIVTVAGGGITRNISVQQQAASAVSTASRTNVAKSIPLISYTDELPLTAFESAFDTPTYNDSGVIRSKWSIFVRIGGSPFASSGIKPWKCSLTASKEFQYEPGPLVRGRDFVFPTNPDTAGEAWPNDVDPTTVSLGNPNGVRYQDFTSATSYWKLMDEQLNSQQVPASLEAAYDMGASASDLAIFGYANKVAGKSFAAGVFADVEIANHGAEAEMKIAINAGMATKTNALVAEIYSNPFEWYQIVDVNHVRNYTNYPDDSGQYPSGNALTAMWAENPTRISIASRGITNKALVDFANIIPTTEISAYHIDFAKHGSVYNLGNNRTITVRKFGNNWTTGTDTSGYNVQSAFVRYATLAEVHSYYCINKLGRRGMIQGKRLGDRGSQAGLNQYVTDDAGVQGPDLGNSKVNVLANRRYNAAFTLVDYMNGSHVYIWAFKMRNDGDYYNPLRTQDGLLGSFAIIKMLRDSGGIDLFQEMTPLFWNTEYSLDGGTTWKKDKAIDLNRSTNNHLWVRSKVHANGAWELAAIRIEGVEPVSFMARFNGVVKTITADMWETTNPAYNGVALSEIPTEHKEYFYQIYN